MSSKVTYKRHFIKNCAENNREFIELFHIFRNTLKPNMHFREFKAYYTSAKLDYIDATFIVLNEMIIGFCAAAFYTTVINDKNYTIGRAATGILPSYRGNTLPKWKLYKKYIHYWLRHPFRHTILSAYVANPLIYAMICKYTGIAYPKQNTTTPADILMIKKELLQSQNLLKKEGPEFVVEIHFSVSLNRRDEERIFKSKNLDVKYYLEINPKFRQQHGVVVIIPVNVSNVLMSSIRFLRFTVKKIFTPLKTFWQLIHEEPKKEIHFS
jgi:hypothetical protein